MTVNHFLGAIALKLTEIWPDRPVYTDRIPQDADGSFFVGVLESSRKRALGQRRMSTIQFEVLYFLRTEEATAFHTWTETMYDHFEHLAVREAHDKTRLVHLTNARAKKDENPFVFRFLFDAVFSVVFAPGSVPGEDTDIMENLEQTLESVHTI